MSGGEQRMLEIGRALMWDPKLILMDEPSAGLAPGMILALALLLTAGDPDPRASLVELQLEHRHAVVTRGEAPCDARFPSD